VQIFLTILGGEFICEEMQQRVIPVERMERKNDREELELGRVGSIDRQRNPLWGYTAAKGEGWLLGVKDGWLEKIGLLDGGEDVEVREGSEDEDADDALYR
jgi:hypothetical protein